MKSLEELKKIKNEMADVISLRESKEGYKVFVAMGEVGLAVGARKVLNALVEEANNRNLRNVTVLMDGYMNTFSAPAWPIQILSFETINYEPPFVISW